MDINPNEILFSRPTLCDLLPSVEKEAAWEVGANVSEDGWRQIEFVAAENLEYIESEFARIAEFSATHRKGIGWTQIYGRKEYPVAFSNVMFDQLPKLREVGVSVGGMPVSGGFALCTSQEDWFLYGVRDAQERVTCLGMCPTGAPVSEELVEAVVDIATKHRLLLVDWYNLQLVDATSMGALNDWLRD